MGTNYYLRFHVCECCGRYDRLHIGKNYRLLRAHVNEWGEDPTPWGEIKTWEKWKEVLRSGEVQIFNEYGEEEDIEEWIKWREESDPESAHRQHNAWLGSGDLHTTVGARAWLDKDEFSFYAGEFS